MVAVVVCAKWLSKRDSQARRGHSASASRYGEIAALPLQCIADLCSLWVLLQVQHYTEEPQPAASRSRRSYSGKRQRKQQRPQMCVRLQLSIYSDLNELMLVHTSGKSLAMTATTVAMVMFQHDPVSVVVSARACRHRKLKLLHC